MRIAAIRTMVHKRRDALTEGHGASPTGFQPLGVLTIETDAGISGHAFVYVPRVPATELCRQLVTRLTPVLIGADPARTEAIWQRMQSFPGGLHPAVIGAVDVALWDVKGKAANSPVHQLLGGAREKIVANLSAWPHRTVDEYVTEARHYQELGYRSYKIHPPTCLRVAGEDVPTSRDIETAEAVRDAVGPSMDLMLDPAGAYTPREAVAVGRALERFDFLWLEDPLANADDVYGYSKLRAKVDIPVLATENTAGGVFAYPSWVEQRATDALRGDPVIKGGITGLMKIAHLAEAYRMNLEVHDGFSSLANVASLHVALAISNTTAFEILTRNPPGEFGLHHANYGLATPIVVESGDVAAPTGPGLGFEPDWDLLRSDVIEELG